MEGKISQLGQRYLDKLLEPQFFIESCLFIVNKDSKKVPFIWRPAFKKWWENHTNDDFILKARKMGFSAGIEALFLQACVFKENTRAVIVSYEENAARKLMERVQYYIDTCAIPIVTKKTSEHEKTFPGTNSSIWIGTAGQRAFSRGDDITHLHLSERAFYQNDTMVTGVKEAMRNDGMIITETTANGADTPTHELWKRAIEGKIRTKAHFFGWFDDPEYCSPDQTPFELDDEEKDLKQVLNLSWGQLRWRREKIASMDKPELFVQEYPSSWKEAFMTSGQLVFKWQDIKRQEDGMSPIKWHGHICDRGGKVVVDPSTKGCFKVWRTPRNAF